MRKAAVYLILTWVRQIFFSEIQQSRAFVFRRGGRPRALVFRRGGRPCPPAGL